VSAAVVSEDDEVDGVASTPIAARFARFLFLLSTRELDFVSGLAVDVLNVARASVFLLDCLPLRGAWYARSGNKDFSGVGGARYRCES